MATMAKNFAYPDFAELDIPGSTYFVDPGTTSCQKMFYPNHIPTPKPNLTHKLSLKSEGNDQLNNADVEAPNPCC